MDIAKANKRTGMKTLILVAVVLLAAGMVVLGALYANASQKIDTMNSRVTKLQQDAHLQAQLLYNEVDYEKSLSIPVIQPKDNQIVFPELKVALPYTATSKTLRYTADPNGDLRVTSTLLNDHKTRQLSCLELVRMSLKNGTPYSPWEESAGSVKLADGRTVYLISAKAFKNNEASTVECASQVWTQITPAQVAGELKKLQNY